MKYQLVLCLIFLGTWVSARVVDDHSGPAKFFGGRPQKICVPKQFPFF